MNNSDRQHTIRAMLERYDEARSASSGPGGSGRRHESRLNQFDPHTWTAEYQELERCLDRLRWLAHHGRPMIEKNMSSGAAWWHLRERYLNARTTRRLIHSRVTRTGHRVPARLPANTEIVGRPTILHGTTSSVIVRTWDARVDPGIVDAAVRWLAREYVGTPALYKENAA